MATTDEVPLVNGINYAWANITCIIAGVIIVGITKISYKNKQTKKNNYGKGTRVISRAYGNVEPDASIEIYTDELKRIIAAAPLRNILKIPPFNIIVQFSGDGVAVDRDVLVACEFLEDPLSTSQGDTEIKVTLPLILADIER